MYIFKKQLFLLIISSKFSDKITSNLSNSSIVLDEKAKFTRFQSNKMFNKKSSESNRVSQEVLKKINQVTYNSEVFLLQNSKKLFFVLGVLLLIIIGYFAYSKFYVEVRQEKALNHLFYARQYFSRNEIKKALGGDPSLTKGGYMGFADIIENFSSTPAANIAHFYAGLSNYNLGNYEKALELWKGFSAKDEFLFPMKYGIMADTYVQLDKNNQALTYYIKAAEARDNDFTTPLYFHRAAMISFSMGKYDQARKYFIYLNERYPKSAFAEETDKYLSLMDAESQK
ncbi:tetratricopeptide repeat protein [Bacteroidetes bacterium endosymbiont of Geopemphigus sp.]|uniref:tetratricopeptide repeat protein n=1 Tax=Bacteroidetes bacterium endosymbiont of Geopemphigus sp. TaxID=2047937 RepID=UPI0018A879D6|nr:tetratricopeptide repeat protein [Bacteroidetes bacterium endosymbiont of Geopemphigus sp.]